MTGLVELLLDLAASAAGAAIGLTLVIVYVYQRQWRLTRNGARLLPAHVTLVGLSYVLLSTPLLVLLLRAGGAKVVANPVYVTLLGLTLFGFVIGNVSLVLVLRFVRMRDRRIAADGGSPGRRWYDRVHRHPEGQP